MNGIFLKLTYIWFLLILSNHIMMKNQTAIRIKIAFSNKNSLRTQASFNLFIEVICSIHIWNVYGKNNLIKLDKSRIIFIIVLCLLLCLT